MRPDELQVRARHDDPRRRTAAAALVIALGFTSIACDSKPTPTKPPSAPPAATVRPATPAPPTPGASDAARLIPQPPVPSEVPLAPDSARVDLAMPTFSNPTAITNPLFPVSRQESVLMLGSVDGKPFRTEVTLLPFTRIVVWEDQQVETAVSQYLAYLDGRITEIAYDLYAQADDGSVWYFGEDVADFADGAIVTKEGTWLAGKDAPAAMIMPAQPKVGDVFRTENSPGFAFEEVTVTAVDRTLDGPLGRLAGGLIVSELHMDGAVEDKTFGPGYGEFLTTSGPDLEALAMAVPMDAATSPEPAELQALRTGAAALADAAAIKDWTTATARLGGMNVAWSKISSSDVPRLVGPVMTAALDGLTKSVAAHNVTSARQGAINVGRSTLDLLLRYRPARQVDVARFDLMAAQVVLDVDGHDVAGLNADTFTLSYMRDRILAFVSPAVLGQLNAALLDLQLAAADGDLAAASAAATSLRDAVATALP